MATDMYKVSGSWKPMPINPTARQTTETLLFQLTALNLSLTIPTPSTHELVDVELLHKICH